MHLLRLRHFSGWSTEAFRAERRSKVFQYDYLQRMLKRFVRAWHVVGDIGAKDNFTFLEAIEAKTKAIVDPYAGAGGGGLSKIPALPYPTVLFRCEVGKDSEIIPDEFFDVTFSCSVLEHIGQAEAGYDCRPTSDPPRAQELLRDRFCRELFRVMKPGGLTLHTVDHAARNLTLRDNFESAGFVLRHLDDEPLSTVSEALDDPDVVRQRGVWREPTQPMSEEEQRLHGVLFMCFERPAVVYGL